MGTRPVVSSGRVQGSAWRSWPDSRTTSHGTMRRDSWFSPSRLLIVRRQAACLPTITSTMAKAKPAQQNSLGKWPIIGAVLLVGYALCSFLDSHVVSPAGTELAGAGGGGDGGSWRGSWGGRRERWAKLPCWSARPQSRWSAPGPAQLPPHVAKRPHLWRAGSALRANPSTSSTP